MSPSRVPLGEILDYISAELRKAHKKAISHGTPIMKFQECEFEFAIEIGQEAEAGVQVWVLKLGGKAKKSEKNTIKIKYTALEGSEVVAEIAAPKKERKKPIRKRSNK